MQYIFGSIIYGHLNGNFRQPFCPKLSIQAGLQLKTFKTMKSILLLIIALTLSISGFSQWNLLNSGTSEDIIDIYFKNENLGFYIAGKSFGNSIERTTNDGQSWEKVLQDSNMGWSKIIGMENGDLFVYGGNTNQQILSAQSSDNGTTWTIDTLSYFVINPCLFNDIFYFRTFISSKSVLVAKDSSGVHSLLDNSHLFCVNIEVEIFSLQYNNLVAFISKSNDGGITWNNTTYITSTVGGAPTMSSPDNGNLLAFHDTLILTVTYPNQICYSNDGRYTWEVF